MRSCWPAVALFVFCLAPPLRADEPNAPVKKAVGDAGKVYQVPYRLTETQHIMVRAKINGKGPFNFIIDTGAPMLYVSEPAAKKIGLPLPKKKGGARKAADGKDGAKPDPEKAGGDKKSAPKKTGGTVTLERFEIEGGVVRTKIKCIVETPFQLTGMNALGVAGEELHGMIGYTVLAHYKMEIDFTRAKMVWTQLPSFTPLEPDRLNLKKDDPIHKQMEQIDALTKVLAWMMNKKPAQPPLPRGFLGVELAERDGGVTVKGVLAKTPAEAAGLRQGDRIAEVQGKAVTTSADVLRLAARVTAGQEVRLTVLRGGEKKEITLTAGEGL